MLDNEAAKLNANRNDRSGTLDRLVLEKISIDGTQRALRGRCR